MFSEHTYSEDSRLGARSPLYIFNDGRCSFGGLLKSLVVSQFKPVSAGDPLTSIRHVNIIVVKFRCQISRASQCREAVGSRFRVLEMMVRNMCFSQELGAKQRSRLERSESPDRPAPVVPQHGAGYSQSNTQCPSINGSRNSLLVAAKFTSVSQKTLCNTSVTSLIIALDKFCTREKYCLEITQCQTSCSPFGAGR